ncbi:MAG: peptidoglycan DD-metalloendopeptidase family protein [Myxococcales bacterium]|nr:peptidoglycan DD-metalloendopeptidase family protein [Myxococcales bacterium]
MGKIVVVVLIPVLAVLGLWLAIGLDEAPLKGLLIGGVPVRPGDSLEQQLQARVAAYADEEVVIFAGPSQTRRSRRQLGARLELDDVLERAQQMGRSGNPIADLKKWWLARQGRLDLQWPPSIDKGVVGDFISAERERLELPPKAGVTDGEGWSLPGKAGLTLDYHHATAALRRALVAGNSELHLELREVPAPEPILIGSPDGALFDDPESVEAELAEHSELSGVEAPGIPDAVTGAIQWLPSRGDECYEKPPMRPFCDGPRRVPRPLGAAATRASELGLGELSAVRRLLLRPPDGRWIQAAGGPGGPQNLVWPVPGGRFGRGFGFVRKRAAVKDRLHKGVDIPAAQGSPIRAASDGIVAYADNDIRGYGNLLMIVHADGSTTLSAHCRSIFVFPGQRVRSGQIVAEVGRTGMAMGPHLHFEYRKGGQPSDPIALFDHVPPRGQAAPQSPATDR